MLAREVGYPPRHRPHGSQWRQRPTDTRALTAMVDPEPPQTPRLVGEVIRTVQHPDDLVEALFRQFRVTRDDGRSLLTEKRYGCGVHSFLTHFASRVEPVLGFNQVALLQVHPNVTVHLLHLLSSVLVNL